MPVCGRTRCWDVQGRRLVMLAAMVTVALSQPHCSTPGFQCANGGTCVETMSGAHCLCPPGFSGLDCSDRDYCSGQPCGSHGKCLEDDVSGSHSCQCDPQHLGLQCELDVTQQCNYNQQSFCTCDVNGSRVKIPILTPPAVPAGVQLRDVLLGLSGLLLGWIVASGLMSLWTSCWQEAWGGSYGSRQPLGVRPASSSSTRSSLDSLHSDPTGSRPGSACSDSTLITNPQDGKTGTVNVYRAGFNDMLAHQTAVRKSATTYATGEKDWVLG